MNSDLCPACGQKLPDRRGRICSLCELPIKQHDRWHFVGSRVQHRDCEDPQLAKLTEANQAATAAQSELEATP